MSKFIIGIDQSTQGTKAVLVNESGRIVLRKDRPHRQIVNESGWVSHDPEEIYQNTLEIVRELITETGVSEEELFGKSGVKNRIHKYCRKSGHSKPGKIGSGSFNALYYIERVCTD